MAPATHDQCLWGMVLLATGLIVILPVPAAAGTSETPLPGFSIELIHRDSPHSPFYPGNLTASQRIERFLNLSNKVHLLLPNVATPRPKLKYRSNHYLMRVTFGTGQGPRQSYYLALDTGSSLAWTLCEPCPNCIPQAHPPFDHRRSPSWHHLRCPHPLCSSPHQCIDGVCRYDFGYADGTAVAGDLSVDTLTFAATNGGRAAIPNMVFGCTHTHTSPIDHPNGYPEGVFGMAQEALSFARQNQAAIHGRFSYCLPDLRAAHHAYLRFGNDIHMHGNVKHLPFAGNSEGNADGLYYLDLEDISVGSHRLNLAPGIFAQNPDGNGGFIIDSGAFITGLVEPAFDAIEAALVPYFRRFDIWPTHGPREVCFHWNPRMNVHFPGMTLHFHGMVDLHIQGRDLFMVYQETRMFCLMMFRTDTASVYGAMQQHNIRFTFDLIHQQLSFVPENCLTRG